MAEKIKCPAGHSGAWLKGFVPTRHGKKARYICPECGRTFYKPKSSTPRKHSKKEQGG